jgi:hypothetical protein
LTHASAKHRKLDAALADRLGEPGHGGALLPSSRRLRDVRTLNVNDQRQARVLLAQLTECESSRGNRYLRGWAGASNLIGFRGDDDEQGRPTWKLYLAERTPKPGTVPGNLRERQERVSAAVASGVELDDSIPF